MEEAKTSQGLKSEASQGATPAPQPTTEQTPAPVEETTQLEVGTTRPLSVEVELSDGNKLVISKLKAGKYHQAQKFFSQYLSAVQKIASESKIDYTKFVDKDGEPDLAKIEVELEKQGGSMERVSSMLDAVSETTPLKISLVAAVLGKEDEEVANEFYSEDIDKIVSAIMETNDFISNLKNFAAPIEGLGATMTK